MKIDKKILRKKDEEIQNLKIEIEKKDYDIKDLGLKLDEKCKKLMILRGKIIQIPIYTMDKYYKLMEK